MSEENLTRPQFKANVGVFLVCAELSKNNLIAMPTSRNTKGYDIVVLNPETNKSVGIQIKCTDKKEFPIISTHWKDYEKKVEEKILCDFVFVDISNPDNPKYFLLSDEEMKNVLKSHIKKYLNEFKKRRDLTLEQLFDKEEKEKWKAQLWVIKLNEIEKYEGKWETIFNRLCV